MNKIYKLMFSVFVFFFSVVLLTSIPSVSSNDTLKINTFLVYEDSASATSKTVTQGDSFNVVMVAYGHGEALQYEKLELVGSATIFQEYVGGDKIDTYTWLYTRTYTVNSGILVPGTYTLRFTARTVNGNEEYSDLQLIILPKINPIVCGNNIKEGTEQCDYGSLNGQVCNPLYGSSCTYCSSSCKLITLTGPYCGDGTCSNGETCNSCSTDCGVCPDNIKPVVDITNPIATTYTSHRTSLTFSVQDDNLQSCTYKLNGNPSVNIPLVVNGVRTITGITSVVGTNTWTVTCRDVAGNIGTDSVTFIVNIPDTTKPVVDITDPIATTYTSHRTSLTFSVYDDNLKSCSYKLNSNPAVTMQLASNGFNVITGITSVVGTNTWAVTCVDNSGNIGSDSVTFAVTLPIVCGNNIKEGTEQCDYGSLNGQVCNPLYGSSCTYCSDLCKLITLTGPYCGDGVKQSNEGCDDGNKISGDGCSATCQIEETKECILQLIKSVNDTNVKVGEMVSFTLKYKNIGNGACTGGGVKVQDLLNSKFKVIAYSANVKDDSDGQGISFGYSGIPVYDSSTNTLTFNAHTVSPGEEGTIMISAKILEPSQCGDFQISNQFKVWSNEKGWQNSNTVTVYVDDDCYTPICGNNLKEGTEQCDAGINNGKPCNPLYGSSCTYCSDLCKLITLTGPYCGDGTCSNGETCNSCSTDCGVCPPTQICGNNLKEGTEQCDTGINNGKPCNPLYGSSCTYCSDLCKLITLTGPYCGDGTCSNGETCNSCSTDCGVCPPNCGNGIKEGTEQCDDGNNVNGDGCSSICKIECCGDGICNDDENCSNCPGDCGVCPKNCTTCKDSKPLDDSNYVPSGKTIVVYGDSDDSSLSEKQEKSLDKTKFPLIALVLIIGVLILLILIIVIRLSRR